MGHDDDWDNRQNNNNERFQNNRVNNRGGGGGNGRGGRGSVGARGGGGGGGGGNFRGNYNQYQDDESNERFQQNRGMFYVSWCTLCFLIMVLHGHGQADVPFASVCHYRMGRDDFTHS